MATELLYVNLNVNSRWVTNTYQNINQEIEQPTVPNTDLITANKDDDFEEQSYHLQNTTLTEDVDSITIWVYAAVLANVGPITVQVRIEPGVGNHTDYQDLVLPEAVNTYSWYSFEFTPTGANWTPAQIDDLRLHFLTPALSNVFPAIRHTYAEVTEATGGGGGPAALDNSKTIKTILLGSPF